jgi:extradiol dioxygenase family protein
MKKRVQNKLIDTMLYKVCLLAILLCVVTSVVNAQKISLAIKQITIDVKNLETCANWYAKYLGFQKGRTTEFQKYRSILLVRENLEIGLHQNPDAKPIALTLETNNVKLLYEQLKKAGVTFQTELMLPAPFEPQDEKFFSLQDTEGNYLTIKGKI